MLPTPSFLLPPDEVERLRTLRHYDIAGSLQESVFDELVALAARIFSVPISLIALVEENQVYYHANHGLPGLESQPRVEAVCSMAVQSGNFVLFNDLSAEAPPTITPEADAAGRAQGIRFYAGAPLRMPGHHDIGTLCVMGRDARPFSAVEQQLLEKLARLVAQTIAVRRAYLHTLSLGYDRWNIARMQVTEEVQALKALVRYLLLRYGNAVPASEEVLRPVDRRLNDLGEMLGLYQEALGD